MNTWFETDYYENFRCKCGNCRHSCCRGWRIDVSEKEYFRLIGMGCSQELHHRLECAFAVPQEPSPEAFRMIVPNWLGQCPMLDSDGLCMLQKECGEEALPEICRVYPRSLRREGEFCHACCTGSCEAVVELLMKEERLGFHLAERKEEPVLSEPADLAQNGVCAACLAALQNRADPLPVRVRKIAAFLGSGDPVTQEDVDFLLPGLLELSPELEPYLSGGGTPDERVEENVLANHLLYVNFPYADSRITKEEAALGLQALLLLMRRTDESADALAAFFHLAEHTAFYYNVTVLLKHEKAE